MTRDEARQIALDEIKRGYRGREEIVMIDSQTLTKPYGWIFSYNTRRFVEGEVIHGLGGNGPIVVDSATGKVTRLGTARSMEQEIADFESRNGHRS